MSTKISYKLFPLTNKNTAVSWIAGTKILKGEHAEKEPPILVNFLSTAFYLLHMIFRYTRVIPEIFML